MTMLRLSGVTALILCFAGIERLAAVTPNHPVITEVFADPAGASDAPVGRLTSNPHQEYIEIWLPPAVGLAPGLNKDALRLAFYEVEGDDTSSGLGLINYRIDLPTFDLDLGNGLTPGAIARPPSGVVVLGWVDYVGNPPVDLAGTPSTRVALINGGITSATDFVFVAMNGAQFSGTTNFPVPTAISSIEMPGEASSGIIQNGSGAYLLVNRDATGYVQLYDDENVPIGGSANPALPTGTVLGVSCLLDGYAGNDHSKFDVTEQPYQTPTGDDIDLETVLPLGGAFSLLVCQIADGGEHGYARRLLDLVRTTEDAIPGNSDPAADAQNAYRTISNVGPLFPTPGRVHLTDSPAELSVADAGRQVFDVIAGTTGRPGLWCANAGGNYLMQATASAGNSSNPSIATFAAGDPATAIGQTLLFPGIAVTASATAPHNATVTAPVTVQASNVNGASPPVVNPTGSTTATARILRPTTGQNASGQPFQTTVYMSVQGLAAQPGVPNEFAGTSLAGFVAANLGGLVDDERHNGAALIAPATNLGDPILIDAMEDDMPDNLLLYIDAAAPPGFESLVQTVLTSAEQSVSGTYDNVFNATSTLVRAVEFTIAETRTAGGVFTPTERIHYCDATGAIASPTSGLTNVTTAQTFELALLDTNVQQFGVLETGATDDFGIVVQVGRVRPGAAVTTGQFVMLSFTGGREGADLDTLDVPPHNNRTNVIYLDLDNLDTVLGCETITRLYLIDSADTGGEVNIIEAFSLNVQTACLCKGDVNQDGFVDGRDVSAFVVQILAPGNPATDPAACAADLSNNGAVGAEDIPLMTAALLQGACQ